MSACQLNLTVPFKHWQYQAEWDSPQIIMPSNIQQATMLLACFIVSLPQRVLPRSTLWLNCGKAL